MQPEETAIKPHWLTRKGISPLQFGLSFLILVAIPLTLWSLYVDQNINPKLYGGKYISFSLNINWSLSLLVVFPLFLGLSLHFYNSYPKILQYLYNTTATVSDKTTFQNLCKNIDRSVNHKLLPFVAIFVAILFNTYVYNEYLSNCEVISWMTNGDLFKHQCSNTSHFNYKGLSNRGLAAFAILVFLTTWVFIFAIRSLLYIRGLFELFNSQDMNIRLDPFHPDGVSGLEKLSGLATLHAMILFLLGIYVSLKVVDRIYFQEISLFADIHSPVVIVCYVVLAPTMFFLILGSAHRKMRAAKQSAITIICEKIKDILNQIRLESDSEENRQNLEYLKSLQERKSSLEKSLLVWPFNVKSIQGFFSAVLTPLIAPLITGAVEFFNFLKQLSIG